MNRYANIDCPACGKPLDDGNAVVVCPTCGAPYHLDCYKKEGACIFTELHEKNEAWEAPVKEAKFDGTAQLRCSRCNTVNPANGIFCEVCGNLLSNKETSDNQQNGQASNVGGMGGGFVPFGMPLNPYTTPFGGVSPDEDIDDIPAKDLAIFVGRNSHYYLPRFKQLSMTKGKGKIINWGAFFFTGGFYFYRKMYGWGILLWFLTFLCSIPSTLLMFDTLNTAAALSAPAVSIDANLLATLSMFANFLNITIKFAAGFFANSLYKRHSYKKIAKTKIDVENDPSIIYAEELTKKGSVATKLITALLIGYMIIMFLSTYMLLMIGI